MIGQFPADTRLPVCEYCGHVSDGAALRNGYAAEVCADCDARNLASDLYKDETGVRPRGWTLRQCREYLRAVTR